MLNETATTLIISLANKSCIEQYSKLQCYIRKHGENFSYLILAFALLPQIFHLFKYRHRYIAGISYIWIIIRIFALMSLLITHSLKWLTIFQYIVLMMSILIFIEIIIFSNNLHRQNKILLIIISAILWISGELLIFILIKQRRILINIVHILFAIQMLPQILLNSLLRTPKALSKLSIIFLLLSDFFRFFAFTNNQSSNLCLITTYYSFSFLLYICFQYLIHNDAHIHLISRSTHTILTPGVDIFTGLDVNGKRINGENPQIFSNEEHEPMDDEDIIYQAVTTNKSTELSKSRKIPYYALSGLIFSLQCFMTIVLIYRIPSFWILLVPLSILFILIIFLLISTRLNGQYTEILRKIL